jgi:hypothetical protein
MRGLPALPESDRVTLRGTRPLPESPAPPFQRPVGVGPHQVAVGVQRQLRRRAPQPRRHRLISTPAAIHRLAAACRRPTASTNPAVFIQFMVAISSMRYQGGDTNRENRWGRASRADLAADPSWPITRATKVARHILRPCNSRFAVSLSPGSSPWCAGSCCSRPATSRTALSLRTSVATLCAGSSALPLSRLPSDWATSFSGAPSFGWTLKANSAVRCASSRRPRDVGLDARPRGAPRCPRDTRKVRNSRNHQACSRARTIASHRSRDTAPPTSTAPATAGAILRRLP